MTTDWPLCSYRLPRKTPGSGERSPEAPAPDPLAAQLWLYPKETGNMPIRDPSRRAEIAALRKWPARPAIFLTAGLSLLVVLAACSTKTKGKEGDQEEKQAALAKPQTPLTPIDWT